MWNIYEIRNCKKNKEIGIHALYLIGPGEGIPKGNQKTKLLNHK